MFDTKIAIVLREGLAPWQELNVTAFLSTGIAAQFSDIIGEPYRDAAGHVYNPLSIQPIVVLSADAELMRTIHRRSLERGVVSSAYIEEMFATGHDAANRAVFAEFTPENAKLVGIACVPRRRLSTRSSRAPKCMREASHRA